MVSAPSKGLIERHENASALSRKGQQISVSPKLRRCSATVGKLSQYRLFDELHSLVTKKPIIGLPGVEHRERLGGHYRGRSKPQKAQLRKPAEADRARVLTPPPQRRILMLMLDRQSGQTLTSGKAKLIDFFVCDRDRLAFPS